MGGADRARRIGVIAVGVGAAACTTTSRLARAMARRSSSRAATSTAASGGLQLVEMQHRNVVVDRMTWTTRVGLQ